MKNKLRKFLAAVLSVIILCTVVPMNVFATTDPVINIVVEAEKIFYDPDALEPYDRISFYERRSDGFPGSFGGQLFGETKLFYDAMVEYYDKGRNIGDYVYELSEPLIFEAKYNKITKEVEDNEDGNLAAARAYINSMIFDSADAFIRDEPDVFWFRNSGLSYSYSVTPDYDQYYDDAIEVIDVELTVTTVKYEPYEIYDKASADMAGFDAAVSDVINELKTYFKAQGPELTREGKLRYIHDYICTNSDYDHAGAQNSKNDICRSAKPFFIGNKLLVCEGYAKTLKVICDAFGIPCVLISGCTRDNKEPGNRELDGSHMWNYVQMEDGNWYLMDITWDDQTTKIYDTYFLADWNSKGFFFETIKDERYERYTFSKYTDGTVGRAFTYPSLNTSAYVSHTHIWGEYSVVKAATCKETGEMNAECTTTLCDGFKTEVIPVDITAHEYTSEITVQPTHLKEGEETFTCKCGDKYTEVVAKLKGHTYNNSVVTAPTCEAKGYTTYICECGHSYDADYKDALDHIGGIADCKEKAVCTRCEKPYGEADANNHKTVVTDKAVAATCTSTGLTEGSHCSACGTVIIARQTTDKLKHGYTSEITVQPTHLKEGEETFTCKCGDKYTEVVAKLKGHTYNNSVVTAPTCEAKGYTTYTCECGYSYNDNYTDKTAHSYKGTTCENCGYDKVENCGCGCHKKGLGAFIWKIKIFFSKLFKKNQICTCGVYHY